MRRASQIVRRLVGRDVYVGSLSVECANVDVQVGGGLLVVCWSRERCADLSLCVCRSCSDEWLHIVEVVGAVALPFFVNGRACCVER